MNHKVYKIQKGDTLHSIAEKFQLSTEALRTYHNLHCELSDLLSGEEKLPRHLEIILFPAGQITGGDKFKINTPLSFGHKEEYKIEIKNLFLVKNDPMSENQTESIWEISENKNAQVDIQVKDKKIHKYDTQLKTLIEVINKINESSDHLQIALNKDGTIQSVLNKNEILERWEEIKFQDVKFSEMQDDFVKIIVEQYNKAFQNISKLIKENMLYQVVFCPKNDLRYPVLYTQPLKKNIEVNSLIFPQKNIYYDWSYTGKEEKEYIQFSLQADVPSTRLQHFKELYEKGYAAMLQSPFNPEFKIEGKYMFHKQTGKLKQAYVYVKEQMSKELLYIVQYKITRISSDEPENTKPNIKDETIPPNEEKPKAFTSRFLFD